MNATFKTGKVRVADENGKKHDQEVDLVVLSGGYLGKDALERVATDEDKALFKAEYDAFKNPPAPPEDKDAKIAALEADLAEATKPKAPAA